MYVTRNTEYHFRDQTCVAVRDRKTKVWKSEHLALRRKVTGTVRFYPNGTAIPTSEDPAVGEALYFGDGKELVTSLLCAIERPDKLCVAQYPFERAED
jgi:hypothetical protein